METNTQGTDRLHEWSDGINAFVSNNSIRTSSENVKENTDVDSTANEATAQPSASTTAETAGEEADGSVLTEPDMMKLNERAPLVRLAHALGYKILFDSSLKTPQGVVANGKIDRKNKIITLNPAVEKPITWILKHELTHSIEKSEYYNKFIKKLKNSDEFKKWLAKQTGLPEETSLVRLQEKYREMVRNSRQNGDLGYTEAQSELVADFVGDVLFSGDSARIKSFLSSLGSERQSFIEKVKEFFRTIKNLFTQDGRRLNEIDRLEKVFLQAADDVMKGNVKEETKAKTETKNTAEDSGIKWSIKKHKITENEIKRNSIKLQKMSSVIDLNGDELDNNGTTLKNRLSELFKSWGNVIVTDLFGDIYLTNSTISDDIYHGLTRNKITSFAAIPDVLKKGVVIDSYIPEHKQYERFVIAAPITISNKPFYWELWFREMQILKESVFTM